MEKIIKTREEAYIVFLYCIFILYFYVVFLYCVSCVYVKYQIIVLISSLIPYPLLYRVVLSREVLSREVFSPEGREGKRGEGGWNGMEG